MGWERYSMYWSSEMKGRAHMRDLGIDWRVIFLNGS